MKKYLTSFLAASAFLGVLALMTSPTQAQDVTSLLSHFLVDLRAGTLGVNQAISNIRIGNGTSSAPSLASSTNTFDGWFWNSTGHWVYTANGTPSIDFGSGLSVGNAGTIGFTSTANPAGGSPDTTITRVAAGQFGWTPILFSTLGTPANGTFAYCSDCTIAATCAGSGNGALAKRLNGAWVCN